MSLQFVRPRPIPLIMSVAALLLLFGLGTWQVVRLQWKEALIASIEHATKQAPLTELPDPAQGIAALEALNFYPVVLKGTFLSEPVFHVTPRYFHGALGYHIFSPFKTDDGALILINRGWVPAAMKSSVPDAPKGEQTLHAQIRIGEERNTFTPPSSPEKNVWFGRDVAAMAAHSGLQLLPYTLDLFGAQDKAAHPIPSGGEIALRNDHLAYAFTWYSIGVGVLIITLVYHRKKPESA